MCKNIIKHQHCNRNISWACFFLYLKTLLQIMQNIIINYKSLQHERKRTKKKCDASAN